MYKSNSFTTDDGAYIYNGATFAEWLESHGCDVELCGELLDDEEYEEALYDLKNAQDKADEYEHLCDSYHSMMCDILNFVTEPSTERKTKRDILREVETIINGYF